MKYVIISHFVQSYLCHYLAPGAANLAHMIQSSIIFLLIIWGATFWQGHTYEQV